MLGTTGTDAGPDEATYIMNRAAGGGCVLGGCLQKDNWDGEVDPELSKRIMTRCVEICPDLVPKGKGIEALSIIREWAGLRPMRKNGIRIEKELVHDTEGKLLTVVHNYGHGGYGFQTSYGCAYQAVELVDNALRQQASS